MQWEQIYWELVTHKQTELNQINELNWKVILSCNLKFVQQTECNLSSFLNSMLLLKSQKQKNKTEFISAIIQSLSQWETKIINNSDLVLPSLYIIQQVTKQMGEKAIILQRLKALQGINNSHVGSQDKMLQFHKNT